MSDIHHSLGNADGLTKSDPLLKTDRRTANRVNIEMPCAFKLGDGVVYRAVTKDIADSGVAISSTLTPQKGTPVQILFKGYGYHVGHVSRAFEGGFAISLPQSSLAVLALSQI